MFPRAWSRLVLALSLACLGAARAHAQASPFDINQIDPATFQAIATRIPDGKTVHVDGKLDDEVWQTAAPSGHFIQREPRYGEPTTERTEFRILYDDRKLYFGIWAYDSDAAGIRASEMKRDSGLHKGDQIKVSLDTFLDHRNAFYFGTNPLGAFKDANSVENGRTINYDWNAVWENRTSRDDKGWYVEMAIPLSQLRFQGKAGDTTWGLNICRIIIRKREEAYWSPFPREWGAIGFSNMTRAGLLLGLKDLPSRRRVELVPFLAPRAVRDYDAGTPATVDQKYGFDLRLGLTPSLSADVTYHTDFAQVEADQEVVNLSRFSLFFPEKRQFFTEGAGIFDYGRSGVGFAGGDAVDQNAGLLPVFYSRRIGLSADREVPLLGGGKVTGRAGPYAIGAINIQTGTAVVRDASGDPARIAGDNFSVVRVKRNVLKKSSVGVILLNRQGERSGDFNRGVGVDAGLAFRNSTTVAAMLARTSSPGTGGSDAAGAIDAAYKTDRFSVGGTYLDIGRRFNAEMGFIPRNDIRNTKVSAAWTPRPKWRGVRQLTVGNRVDHYRNHDGRTESRTDEVTFKIERQDSSSFALNVDRDYDFLSTPFRLGAGTIPVGGHTWNTVRMKYASNQSRRVFGSAGTDVGSYYNGDKQTWRAAVNLAPHETLVIENTYTRNRISLGGSPYFTTNTLSTRVSYSFTPALFVKGFVQYNDDRRLATINLLLWYIYRPGSDFYVVYNNGWETGAPGAPPVILRTRSRSLAVKMTYWLSR